MFTNRIELRTYHTNSCSHAHDFAQLVLPVSGSMELEVGSYFGLMNSERGVYIAPNDRHCFAGSEHNLFVVIDLVQKKSSDQGLKSNLHHAKTLLTHSNASIESIAFKVGYEHLSAFSRRFSQTFGASPSQWRTKALMAKKMRDLDK